jgi:hypothetical protein
MTSHAYPANALAGDYGRAALGFSLVILPLVTVDLAPWAMVILASLAALFAIFALRTADRHAAEIRLDESGIASLGWRPAKVKWANLDTVKLAFYATKRDGSNGWMQLALKGGGRWLTVDSRIAQFETILRAVAEAVRARGLKVSPATAANFAAYGIELEAS